MRSFFLQDFPARSSISFEFSELIAEAPVNTVNIALKLIANFPKNLFQQNQVDLAYDK